MPIVNPSAFGPKPFYVDAAGNPDLSYKLFAYVAGSTSTKQDTYTDSTGNVANTNPIILNALGQTPNGFWWPVGLLYKIVLAPATDTDPPTNPVWTIDNLQGINDATAAASVDEWILFSTAPVFVSATSFTLTGNQTDVFQVGRRIKTTNTSGPAYSTIIASVFSGSTLVTVTNSSGILDSGLSAVYYSILSVNNPSYPAIFTQPVTMQGASLNESEGAPVASAGTTNIWANDGNTLHITGNVSITSFGTAPNIGAWKKVIFDGTPALVQSANLNLNAGGANVQIQANDAAFIYADSTTQFDVFVFRANGAALSVTTGPVQGAFKNLKLSADGVSSQTVITADEITAEDASGNYVTLKSISQGAFTNVSGVGGLDTGVIAISTWYAVWVIFGTSGTAAIYSLSSTVPTMPTGFTFRARVGWMRTDASANKLPLSYVQYGRIGEYKVAVGSNVTALPTMASGIAGSATTPTWVAVATGNFVPPTAGRVIVVLSSSAAGAASQAITAPSNAYGGFASTTNAPQLCVSGNATTTPSTAKGMLTLETANISWASNQAAGLLQCSGWEDNL